MSKRKNKSLSDFADGDSEGTTDDDTESTVEIASDKQETGDKQPSSEGSSQNSSSNTSSEPSEDEPICPCLSQERKNWKDETPLPIEKLDCGHAIDYLASAAGSKIGEDTAERRVYSVRLFIEFLHSDGISVCDADFRDIEGYFTHRARQGRREGTLKADLSIVVELYKHISIYRDVDLDVKVERIRDDINPSQYQTENKIEREPLTKKEIKKLFDAMDSFRDRLLVQTALETGARNRAVRKIEIEDIDFSEGKIELYNYKSDRTFTAGITSSLELLLRRWLDIHRPAVVGSEDNEYLFPSSFGECLTGNTFTRIVREAAKDAGIQEELGKIPVTERAQEAFGTSERTFYKVTPHALRHTFSHLLDEAGMELKDRSKMLDHANVDVTEEFYTHSDEDYHDFIKDIFSGVDWT